MTKRTRRNHTPAFKAKGCQSASKSDPQLEWALRAHSNRVQKKRRQRTQAKRTERLPLRL